MVAAMIREEHLGEADPGRALRSETGPDLGPDRIPSRASVFVRAEQVGSGDPLLRSSLLQQQPARVSTSLGHFIRSLGVYH